jgi:D-serine deaminase-like pyridoxal phosphate-dependent protein
MGTFDYHFTGEENLDSPALVYYEDIIAENIKKTIAVAGSAERLWPHIKTHKSSAVVRLLLVNGVRRFKCATIAEAEMCARCNAPDILVSYPLVGPAAARFILLCQRYTSSTFWAIGDNLEQVALLGKAASAAGLSVPFLVDVNCGMNRTGVAFPALAAFCEDAAKIPGLALRGFHFYDGHLHIKDRAERQRAVDEETVKLNAVRKELQAGGLELPVLVMGGTPTFPCHARNKEAFLSPGTLFLNDFGYSKYEDLDFTPGAAILTRVVSRPAGDLFTLDLGSKGISQDNEIRGRIADINNAEPVAQSEEHWVFRMKDGGCPSIGTILYVVPAHICPTNALYPGAHVVRNRALVNYWEIDARNRKLSI